MSYLAEALRHTLLTRMASQGLTNMDLGARCGLTSQSVINLRAGTHTGQLPTWDRVLEALDIDLAELVNGGVDDSPLSRPINPRLLFGDYTQDLSDFLQEGPGEPGIRGWQVGLTPEQLEDLAAGRARFVVDRVISPVAFTFVERQERQAPPERLPLHSQRPLGLEGLAGGASDGAAGEAAELQQADADADANAR